MSELRFKVEKNKIIFNTGKNVSFEGNISKTLVLGKVLIVLLDYMEVTRENVFGVDPEGKILWRIAEEKFHKEKCPYANVYDEHGVLGLSNYCGYDVEADPLTGKILKKEFTK